MGTRADFYLGRGKNATWLGSLSMDGYPLDGHGNGVQLHILKATDVWHFLFAIQCLIIGCKRFIRTVEGWPWPWRTSVLSDFSYAFDDGKVWISSFGRKWITYNEYLAMLEDDEEDWPKDPEIEFPIMREEK